MKKLLALFISFSILLVLISLAIFYISSPIEISEKFLYFLIALFVWTLSPVGLIFLGASFLYFLIQAKIFRFFIWVFQALAIISWMAIMLWLAIARTNFFQKNIFNLNEKALDAGIISGILFFAIISGIIFIQIKHSRDSQNFQKEGGEHHGCFKIFNKFIGKDKS